MDCNYLEGAGRASGYGQRSVVDDVRLLVSSVEYFTVTQMLVIKVFLDGNRLRFARSLFEVLVIVRSSSPR
jgi:hypothetical protein